MDASNTANIYCDLLHPSFEELVRWMCELLEQYKNQAQSHTSAFRATTDGCPWWSRDAIPIWLDARLHNVRKDTVMTKRYCSSRVRDPEYRVPRWFSSEHVVSFFLRADALCQRLDAIFAASPFDEGERSTLTAGSARSLSSKPAILPLFDECRVQFEPFAWFGQHAVLGVNNDDDNDDSEQEAALLAHWYFVIPILQGVTPATRDEHMRRASSLVDIIRASERLHVHHLPLTSAQASSMLTNILLASHPEIGNCLVLLNPRSPRSIKHAVSPRRTEYTRLAFAHACIFLASVDEYMLLFLMRLLLRASLTAWDYLVMTVVTCPSGKPLFWLLVACILDDLLDCLKKVAVLWSKRLKTEGIPYNARDTEHLLAPVAIPNKPAKIASSSYPSTPPFPAHNHRGKLLRSMSSESFFSEHHVAYKSTRAFLTPVPLLYDGDAPDRATITLSTYDDSAHGDGNMDLHRTASSSSSGSSGGDSLTRSTGSSSGRDTTTTTTTTMVDIHPTNSVWNSEGRQQHAAPRIVSFETPNLLLLAQYARLVYCAVDDRSIFSVVFLKQLGNSVMWRMVNHANLPLSNFDASLPELSVSDLCQQRELVVPFDMNV